MCIFAVTKRFVFHKQTWQTLSVALCVCVLACARCACVCVHVCACMCVTFFDRCSRGLHEVGVLGDDDGGLLFQS